MTFRAKLKEEHPEKIDERCAGGCIGCPSNYGYEENYNCNGVTCKDCWNREMPNTEAKGIEVIPQAEVDAWHNAHESGKAECYEQGLNDGRNEVWEFLDRIEHAIKSSVLIEVFGYSNIGDILDHFKPQEALAKLKAYEEAQNKIEIGDVVKSTLYVDINCGIVANITDNKADLVHKDGKFSVNVPLKFLVKTGKHLDLASILEQIGE